MTGGHLGVYLGKHDLYGRLWVAQVESNTQGAFTSHQRIIYCKLTFYLHLNTSRESFTSHLSERYSGKYILTLLI